MRDANGKSNQSWPITFAWIVLAGLASLWVALVNNEPLFYYDTAGYFAHGSKMFEVLGLFQPEAVASGADAAAEAVEDDKIVVGSRSAVYALFVTLFERLGGLDFVVIIQSALLIVTVLVVSRIVLRAANQDISAWPVTALAMVAGALGSAAFYTAYLMPDIFAPIMLLVIACITCLFGRIRLWELLVLLLLGYSAVLMHPSHLAIALAMTPLAFFMQIFLRGRHWIVPGLLVASIAAVGFFERFAFTVTVETATDSEVVYQPFFTARLIDDGVGKRYLDEHCPIEGFVTCDLNELLVRPIQQTATHIMFAVDEERGSFALMAPEQRRKISQEQRAFLRGVALDRPFDLFRVVLRNTLVQLKRVRVDATIPYPSVIDEATSIYRDFANQITGGRLMGGGPWQKPLRSWHHFLYIVSAALLAAILLLPQSRIPRRVRAFGIVVALGIVANAFVMGAISQPAARYGARVVFLLPVLLIILAFCRPFFSLGDSSTRTNE